MFLLYVFITEVMVANKSTLNATLNKKNETENIAEETSALNPSFVDSNDTRLTYDSNKTEGLITHREFNSGKDV